MRVLVVTNDYPPQPGGIQQYLANLVARHQGPVRVLAPAHPGAAPVPQVVRGGRRWMLPTSATRAWITAQAEEFRPDVVVYGAPTPLAQLGPAVRRRTGAPFVVMTHGAEVTVPGVVPGLRQVLRYTFRRADACFAVSRFTARRVESMAGVKAAVLGAGVDVDTFGPAAGNHAAVTIGCVSRFIPRKGHLRVISAAEALARRGHRVEVVLAGKGRLEGRIKRRAALARVPVRVLVDVPWEDLAATYRSFDIFVMPARTRWFGLEVEGLGIVYLEAAASGLPVVAGWSGGAPETVLPGITGYLAEGVPEIVEGIELALQHEGMGEAARKWAEEEWTWERVMDRWHHGLEAVVAAHSPKDPGTF